MFDGSVRIIAVLFKKVNEHSRKQYRLIVRAIMMTADKEKLDAIVTAINKAGYDPIAQLTGYILTGEETYITRRGNARDLIKSIDKETIKDYLSTLKQ